MTAIRLIRGAESGRDGLPLEIVLLDRSDRIARGVAYGTRSIVPMLNVPAGKMSPFPEDEEAFLRYARGRDPQVSAGSFVPRLWFGDYLEALLDETIAKRPAHVAVTRVNGEAVAVDLTSDGNRGRVHLADGRMVDADHIVLALGNLPDASPICPGFDAFQDPRIIADPWAPRALDSIPQDAPILFLGTGLTMIDIALELAARGARGPFHAVSRRGLLPQPHRETHLADAAHARPPVIDAPPTSARRLARSICAHAAGLARDGGDWRDVLGAIRAATPGLWRALPESERERFLRHLRPYWDTHRHRVAPHPYAAIRRMIAAGTLTVHAGRLVSILATDEAFEVAFRKRGARPSSRLLAVRIVRCTGPAGDTRRIQDPLMKSLRSRGLMRPDTLGLGIETNDDGAVVDASGRPSRFLYYVGPFLRARHWEATAVPELRVHARQSAEAILRSASELRASERPAGSEPLVVSRRAPAT